MPKDDASSRTRYPSLRDGETYALGSAKLVALHVEDPDQTDLIRRDTRAFVKDRGVTLDDSEIVLVQQPCRDPDPPISDVLVLRKTCSLPGKPQVSLVFLL